MECNKEEAIRAKGIAEKKMQNKDFLGARKIALKAQQLYPDLENISQLIMVCDVHCSAENKVYANEKDWYGILKIKPMADEASIRKQYRKFALLLHPDKNKFAGATDAFQLVGEAQRVLLDRGKRKLHDSICKTSRPTAPNWAPQQASKTTSPFTSSNPQHQQPQRQTQPGFPNDQQTFWTACPFCSVSYRFYIDMINKQIHCQSCKKFFPGIIKSQATPPGTNSSQPAFPQQKEVPNQGAFKATTQGNCGNVAPKVHSQGNVSSENQTGESVPKAGVSEVARESKANEKCGNMDVKINETGAVGGSKYSGEMNAERRKQVAESSENCSTNSSSDSVEDIHTVDNGDDCDFGRPLKRPKCSESFRATEDPLLKQEASKINEADNDSVHTVENVNKVKRKESALYEDSSVKGKEESQHANGEIRTMKDKNKSSEASGKSSLNSSPVVGVDTEIYEYPDPEFNNFDKDRREDCFAVGQIWAIYDTLDAMPRFYAQIRKVYLNGFKLLITWLEPDPDDEHETKWVDKGLPVSCGKFKSGNSENTEVHLMFSHLVSWEGGSKKGTYKVYPRKGETWALFKNWDLKWHSDPDSKREYEFEFVEVLSDYSEGIGVFVANLGKVKGFSCLFCRIVKKGMDSFQIPSNQLFRFSHRVPSFQMSSEVRKDVPKGSFELDPASLPAKLEEIAVPEDLKVEAENLHSDISSSESPAEFVKPEIISEINTSDCQLNKKTQSDPGRISSNNCIEDPDASRPLTPYAFEIPEPDFNNFDGEKSVDKFQIGQFWALYCDDDGMPKYYAQIKKIENQPEFILHIRWLVACPLPKNAVQWIDKDMPIGCGIFRLQNSRTQRYTEIGAFSHQLRVEHTDKKDVYAISPRKGEVWALYKNWNAGMTCSDLETCEYDMVEILEENDLEVKVLVLELVYGFRSVFKAQLKEGSALTMAIARMELLRFSHQIPAFRLKDEGGGSLRGYWELDTAALPITLLCSS